MNHPARAIGHLEQRIHDAERNLFAAVGADVDEFVLELDHNRLTASGAAGNRADSIARTVSR
jgi:hypothetical protein